jgi:putative SOS response-associated peptidase YedK
MPFREVKEFNAETVQAMTLAYDAGGLADAMYSVIPSNPISNLQPRFNICPTDNIDVIVPEFDQRRMNQMRWGLVPAWWKKPLKELPATFNARAETVADKPMFRDAFKRSRCLIPASGYYEWKQRLTPSSRTISRAAMAR